MKIFVLVWTTILCCASPSSLPAQDRKDLLWGRAVEIFSQIAFFTAAMLMAHFMLTKYHLRVATDFF